MTGSRPFLNLLNPLGGRAYRGYEQARDDVVEEQDEDEYAEDGDEYDDRGEGPSSRPGWMRASVRHGSGAGGDVGASRIRTHGASHDDEDDDDDDDGEVPQSFLIEGGRRPRPAATSRDTSSKPKSPSHPRIASRAGFLGGGLKQAISMPPRPSDLQSAADFALPLPNTANASQGAAWPKQGLDEYERALWNWVNVYNLDAFLQEVRQHYPMQRLCHQTDICQVYAYYTGKGIYCIALSRGLNLLCVLMHFSRLFNHSYLYAIPRTIGFVIGFSTFLLGCVDYSAIPGTSHLSEVIVPRCVSKCVPPTSSSAHAQTNDIQYQVLRLPTHLLPIIRRILSMEHLHIHHRLHAPARHVSFLHLPP